MSLNHLKFIFLVMLIYISFVGWSSNSWLMIWFIMEVVFLIFIGLVLSDVSYGIVELLIKYFITQVFISIMFAGLMVICLFNLSFCISMCLGIVLFMKLGLFPFHFWVISVLGKLNWFSFLLMLTVIKLLPVLLMYYLNIFLEFNIGLLFSAVGGSIFGISNTVVQKLLGYSSIVHLCWLLLGLGISVKVFMIYFLCYFIMMFVFVYIFSLMNIYYINQFKLFSSNIYIKFLFFFLILSFAGFPPFMGFLIKWIVMSMLFFLDFKILIFFMVSFSLFTVFFYLELFFYFMIISSVTASWYSHSIMKMSNLVTLVLLGYLFIYFYF